MTNFLNAKLTTLLVAVAALGCDATTADAGADLGANDGPGCSGDPEFCTGAGGKADTPSGEADPAACDGATDLWIDQVTMVDHKAMGGDPVWELNYRFVDTRLGELQVTCYDALGTSELLAENLFKSPLANVLSDFYCFTFEALTADLHDITDDYTPPSFSGVGAPEVSFEFPYGATLPLVVDNSGITICSRQSPGVRLQRYVVPADPG